MHRHEVDMQRQRLNSFVLKRSLSLCAFWRILIAGWCRLMQVDEINIDFAISNYMGSK